MYRQYCLLPSPEQLILIKFCKTRFETDATKKCIRELLSGTFYLDKKKFRVKLIVLQFFSAL